MIAEDTIEEKRQQRDIAREKHAAAARHGLKPAQEKNVLHVGNRDPVGNETRRFDSDMLAELEDRFP